MEDEMTQGRTGGLVDFIMRREQVLLIGTALTLAWFIVTCRELGDAIGRVPTDVSAEALNAQLAMMLALVMHLPYFVLNLLGQLFYWLAWLFSKRGLALTAAILLTIALPFSLHRAAGLLPGVILGYVGFARLKKRRKG